ncbi:protein translocase subunit SecD [Rhodobacteraceae bacterium HSP-20]|uniref:Protein translocase subunit SecD n=1 Tax=Paragemmobacter amnigenus TaxID=2852097 RepID=A0ABS6J6W9_9RHOB|nr:protein translocase subunit SecD [Rhodobacter amnigenus]MBU9699489.1 protein translocase subunit SecD [Rhodobacter amnigenus]MBV4390716.1 protein translocase subunit SecD [Rhodobacter amnigenus]
MLNFPFWKQILTWMLVAAGLLLALPNLYYPQVEAHNDAAKAVEEAGFATTEQQAALDEWPDWLPSGIVNLGLDLRGGAHLLAEVQVEDVYKARMDGWWPEVRNALRDVRDQVGSVRRQPAQIPYELRVQIENEAGMAAAVEAVRALASNVVTLTGVGQTDIDVTAEGNVLIVQLSEPERAAVDQRTIQQSLEIIRTRVDQAGTREPTIQRQGADRILIQVPGIGSATELKALIGTTAKLTFNPVVRRGTAEDKTPGAGNVSLPSMDEEGVWYTVEEVPVVSGEDLTNAKGDFDQNGRPAVAFQFDVRGARAFGDYTAQNIGAPFAIVLDGKVISAPVIQSHIPGGSGIITGNFTVEEANRLAVLLSAGALPATMNFLEERTIGPELGQDSIDAGRLATVIAAAAVSVLMIASYGLFGVFAVVALAINMAMIFGIMSMIGATLTLPGIAGLVLTIGMAVDANVLIYERMRDELRAGAKSAARAIELGFERALSAIVDANVTTLITAGVLFFLGAGPVRGFAVTLAIGIVTSVFTAINVTRLIVTYWYNRRKPKTLVV